MSSAWKGTFRLRPKVFAKCQWLVDCEQLKKRVFRDDITGERLLSTAIVVWSSLYYHVYNVETLLKCRNGNGDWIIDPFFRIVISREDENAMQKVAESSNTWPFAS